MSADLDADLAAHDFVWLRQAIADVLLAAASLLSVWQIGTYAAVVAQRLTYPYALEWMEGGTLEHVARVLEGKPLYVAPSIDFAPFIYTPLYYWVCALFARLFGLQLPTLRAVSVAASLGVFVLLFRVVFERTRNPLAGLIACGVFAACFEVCGGWFDLARVDSLALCLLLLGTWLLLCKGPHDAWAGGVLALAFLTKQSTAMVAPGLFAVRFLTQRGWRRVQSATVFSAIIAVSTVIQDRLSGGYYTYYVFRLPAEHPWISSMWSGFWRFDVLSNVPFAFLAALFLLTTRRGARSLLELSGVALGYVALGWVSRMHTGGFLNVLMPTMAFFAMAMGEVVGRLSMPTTLGRRVARRLRATSSLSLFWLSGCVLQLAWLIYNPRWHVPTLDGRKHGNALIAYLRGIDGPILAPFDPLLPRLAGRPGNAHSQALNDISYGSEPKRTERAERSIQEALSKRTYAAIVLNGEWHGAELKIGYVLSPVHIYMEPTREGATTSASEVWLRRNGSVPTVRH